MLSAQGARIPPGWLPIETTLASPTPTSVDQIKREYDPDSWTDCISRAFIPLTAEPLGCLKFHGSLQTIERGPLMLTRIEGSGQHVRRGKAELSRSSNKFIYFNLQLSGAGRVRSRMSETNTVVGGAAIVASDEAFELSFEEDFSQLCVSMPMEWLNERLGFPITALPVRHVDTSRGPGRVVGAALAAIIEAASIDEGYLCCDLFAHALIGAVKQSQNKSDYSVTNSLLFGEIKSLIRRRFSDTGFTPSSAAKALGCSVSTLHLNCQRTGNSFGTLVLHARLNAAAEALRAAAPVNGRVEQVASASGFADPSHFSRKFKERFGVRPSQYK